VQSHLAELDAEKMRQLYVALTRAKTWLYIPFIPPKKSSKGTTSPLHLFLAKMGQSESLKDLLPSHPAITIEQGLLDSSLMYRPKSSEVNLLPPILPSIPGRSITIDSFTSLSKQHPKPLTIGKQATDPVPAGTETGIVIHKIFEMIDYASPDIAPFLTGTLLEPWATTIDSWVRNALNYRFPEDFTLAEVSPLEQFREIEFLYPTPTGYLKGVIDLMFHYQGKIHIIDWKSNLLQDYSQESLKGSMTDHDYFLQAKLYKEAAKRYFGDLPIAIDYFFIRGSAVYRVEESHVE
jgi:exodeoxyribonuclease V beta subunit